MNARPPSYVLPWLREDPDSDDYRFDVNERYDPDATAWGAGGTGWAPESEILLADGSRKHVEVLCRGDMVWTPTGPASVEYVIEMGIQADRRVQNMCHVNKRLWITPCQPILFIGNIWGTPTEVTQCLLKHVTTVYNLVLKEHHIVDVNGVLTCTLGHGMTGPVIGHNFFGNKDRILDAIRQRPGFDVGRPVYDNLTPVYGPATSPPIPGFMPTLDRLVGWENKFYMSEYYRLTDVVKDTV